MICATTTITQKKGGKKFCNIVTFVDIGSLPVSPSLHLIDQEPYTHTQRSQQKYLIEG
jgi:hypothetical protein